MVSVAMAAFLYSEVEVEQFNAIHDNGQFVDMHAVELYMVSEEDDTKEDRIFYSLGKTCPLQRGEGCRNCRAFKDKLWYCQSMVSEKVARNHLAKTRV